MFSGHENYLSKPLQSHLDFFPDSLVDSAGQILIPGIYEAVAPLTEKKKKLYEGNEYDLDQIKAKYGIKHFLYTTKVYDTYIFILVIEFSRTGFRLFSWNNKLCVLLKSMELSNELTEL